MNKPNVEIYACYLPGSTKPDYIGSHNVESNTRHPATLWLYSFCRYLGQGLWIHKETGALAGNTKNKHRTPWGHLLLNMTPEERLAIRVEVLVIVASTHRWVVELEMIYYHKPKYNKVGIVSVEELKCSVNGDRKVYMKNYRKTYNTEEKRRRNREYQKAYHKKHYVRAPRREKGPRKTYIKKPLTEEQRLRYNEYRKTYMKEYFARNPDKVEANRIANRLRMRSLRKTNPAIDVIPAIPPQ